MENLKNKVAVVFAATGAIAGAVSRSFAQHGAKLYISGRNGVAIKALAAEIKKSGGYAEAAVVDATDEREIDAYLQKIVADNDKLDIVFNGIGLSASEQGVGVPAIKLPFAQFMKPIEVHCGSQFLTSRTAAAYMIQSQSRGTILTLTAGLSRVKIPTTSGITAACTAIEGMTRVMAAEFGRHGIKVICLNSNALQETERIKEVQKINAGILGVSPEDLAAKSAQQAILGSGPTLRQVGEVAAFLVSDHGVTFNSHIVDVDCGMLNVI